MEPTILFEDAHVVVIAKPAGMLVHADGSSKSETVSDWFVKRYPDCAGVGESQTLASGEVITRPGIVHRLDRETSGVMILAKTQEAYEHLKLQFQNREAHKTYLALTYGAPKIRRGVIDFSIGRSRKDFRLRSAQPKAKGVLREAITRYEVIADEGGYALMKLSPKTGRTHQIRVHLKALHHPVVGDALYAPNREVPAWLSASDVMLALHAYKLEITLPGGTRERFTAPLPSWVREAYKHIEGAEGGIAKQN